jgi:hypothetical protein
MSALFVRTRRRKFVGILGRYWDAYLSTWSVLMHGNPAVNIYGGIKLAACGELGIGVGEEERGSGERDVLEGFVGRVEGLVDLVVSRFGDPGTDVELSNKTPQSRAQPTRPWLGSGEEPAVEDGAIFLGVGALSRKSVKDVTHWMEDLYTWGLDAYGVVDNPSSTRRPKKNRAGKNRSVQTRERDEARKAYGMSPKGRSNTGFNSPPTSPVTQDGQSIQSADASPPITVPPASRPYARRRPSLHRASSSRSSTQIPSNKDRIVSLMKLGYGTHWTLGGSSVKQPKPTTAEEDSNVNKDVLKTSVDGNTPESPTNGKSLAHIDPSPTLEADDSIGHYLIGLSGDFEAEELSDSEQDSASETSEHSKDRRTMLRILTVELEREGDARAEKDISIDLSSTGTSGISSKHGGSERTETSVNSFESQDRNKTKKLRVVVYVAKPFIFTFLFEQRTQSLAWKPFYRSLHEQLAPLRKALLISTTYRSTRPEVTTTTTEGAHAPIYDLIWDPKLLTTKCTIPSIPVPSMTPTSEQPSWSRVEALNTHSQILNTFISTRDDRNEMERTCKTSRGYWVVWTRIPDPEDYTATDSRAPSVPDSPRTETSTPQQKSVRGSSLAATGSVNRSGFSGPAHPFLDIPGQNEKRVSKDKEIFLVRKASDYVPVRPIGRFASGSVEDGWGSSTGKLAQGIGVDTKRYIEGLLHLT